MTFQSMQVAPGPLPALSGGGKKKKLSLGELPSGSYSPPYEQFFSLQVRSYRTTRANRATTRTTMSLAISKPPSTNMRAR